jgi:hypothetical protein
MNSVSNSDTISSNVWIIVDNELQCMCKKAITAWLKVLSSHLRNTLTTDIVGVSGETTSQIQDRN